PSATSSSVMPKGIWSFILFLHRPRIGELKVFPGWKGNLLGVGIFNVAKRRMGIILWFTRAFRSRLSVSRPFLQGRQKIAPASSPLPGCDEPSRYFPRFRAYR